MRTINRDVFTVFSDCRSEPLLLIKAQKGVSQLVSPAEQESGGKTATRLFSNNESCCMSKASTNPTLDDKIQSKHDLNLIFITVYY